MRLISSKGKGKHTQKRDKSKPSKASVRNIVENKTVDTGVDVGVDVRNKKADSKKMSTRKKVLIIVSCIIGFILLLGASTFAVVRWEIQPFYDFFFRPGESVLAEQPVPNVVLAAQPVEPDSPVIEDTADIIEEEEEEEEVEEVPDRNTDMFTFLIFGIDLYGNTDVIMVARFDSAESKLDVVSIPRDTVVNVPWNLKKANSIHAHARNMYKGQNVASDDVTAETVKHFRSLLGFNIDFMITISMGAFPRIVDAIGPIEFNVPRSVNLEGMQVSRGTQRLNGRQALAVMRDRNAHSDGDIGRATTQQEFLNTIMKQFLANRNSVRVDDMADIFLRHTNTNIQLNNLVWFGNEFLKLSADDIHFHMMPGEFESLRGNFYITVQLEPWLKIVNDKLSPLNREITKTDVSILTRGPDRMLYVTDGDWQGSQSWGASSRGSSNPQTTTGRHER